MSTSDLVSMNGLYDILCAFSILNIAHVPILNDLHMNMFHVPYDPMHKRLMGYLLLSYGSVRLSYNFHKDNRLVAFSYLLEAYIYFMEMSVYNTTNSIKSLFVILVCIVLSTIQSIKTKN